MRAHNKRTNQMEEVASIDFMYNTIHLVQANSNPKFIYREKLDNVILLQEINKSDVKKEDKTKLYIASNPCRT